MADLTLPAKLVEQLEEMAQRENRSVESLIAALIKEHATPLSDQMTTNAVTEGEERLKEARIRLYDIARRYWRDTNDPRQGMTNDELEVEFWLIDQDGIPRLKSEQGTIGVSESPLQSILDSVSLNPSLWSFGKSARNIAERSREILQNEYADYLLARMKRPPVPRDE